MPIQRADVTYLHALKDISIWMQERRKNVVPSVIELNWMIRSFTRSAQIEAWNMQEVCYSLPICWCRNPESTCTNNFYNQQKWKPFGKKDLWMQSNEGGWRKLSISNKAHCSTVKSTRNTRKQECCYRASFRRKENTEDGTTIVGRFPVFRLPLFDNWPKNKYTLHTTLSVFFLLLVPALYIFKQLLSKRI